MLRFASLVALVSLVACTDSISDLELAQEADLGGAGGKADASWDTAPTLHVGERVYGYASTGGRRVYPVWLAGTSSAPVTLDIVASAQREGDDVRVAVLGPLKNGAREVIGAAGYSTARTDIELTVSSKARGEHLVVVGSFDLATETSFSVSTHCRTCTRDQVDVLAEPKAGALVASENGDIVQMELGAVLANRNYDVEVELWASPPAQAWAGRKVATSVASGTQVNVIVPASVLPGDDLRLVVRKAGGAILDTGVVTRFAPVLAPLVRTDALLYGDLVGIDASGIVGYYEGVASMSMRSETRKVVIADHDIHIDRPGQVGNGFGAFDASFYPPIELASGALNPNLPRNGDVLSIGYVNGNGDYKRIGCFEYCNDLSGEETCTGGTRSCPKSAW